jgi:transmembrane sensor
MNTQEPGKLLDKYNAGLCTPEEQAIVESWYLKLSKSDAHGLDLSSAEKRGNEAWSALSANTNAQASQTLKKHKYLKYWPAAAVLIAAIGFSLYTIKNSVQQNQTALTKNQDIMPGTNKALLTLASGKKMALEQQVYTVPKGKGQNGYNLIETPRAGQYQVNLPDGTRVWLNAASSLRYPSRFSGTNRTVELTGEGYFEVAKNKQHPFVVKTDQQEVQVLGTHFNINSYTDERSTNTTLVEGSVRVTASNGENRLLKPGEQSQLNGKEMEVAQVDTETVLSWKNGDFVFKGDDFKSIMRKISRWYDVEVVYEGDFADLKFGGYISRTKNISAVLSIMESTGKVHFHVKEKRITVSR